MPWKVRALAQYKHCWIAEVELKTKRKSKPKWNKDSPLSPLKGIMAEFTSILRSDSANLYSQ